jgi:membrane protein
MGGRSARVAVAAARRFVDDGMVDRAPALAYYGVLSLFPLLLIAFSVLRLAGGADAPEELAAYARDGGASSAVAGALRSAAATAIDASAETAGSAGAAGLLALLYGASRAFTAAGRAMDVIAGQRTPRRSTARRAQDIAWTVVVLALVSALVLVVLVSGRVLEVVLDALGLEDRLDVWSVIRVPAAAVMGLLIVALVRWSAPTARPHFRLATPGVVVSIVALVVFTVGYDVYVSTIATYNATYGAFAAGIVLLLWVWLASVAFLFGAELDAVLDEGAPTPPKEGGGPVGHRGADARE